MVRCRVVSAAGDVPGCVNLPMGEGEILTTQDKAVDLILKNPSITIDEVMFAASCGRSVAYAAMAAVAKIREADSKRSNVKTILAISDLHCGHRAGLTPPEWWVNDFQDGLKAEQMESWEWYRKKLIEIGKVDVLFILGDCIDGKGARNGGVELITADRHEQVKIAIRCIEEIPADKLYMVHGTPYHTGEDEDFESMIAARVGGEIASQLWVDVNGIVFNLKHKIGGSSVPYGRGTPLGKENLWNRLWADIDGAPRANVFLRGHVHYHAFTGDREFLSMSLPALQSPSTMYGARQCSGTVDFGMVSFRVREGDSITTMRWEAHIDRLQCVAPKLMVA